jgi:hypothetical protein
VEAGMRAIVIILAAMLTACAPQPAPAPPAPNPLAMTYSVQVAQATLANVRDVAVSGADIQLVEVLQGGGGGLTLAPGRIGRIDLVITTDWDAAEQTMETWRASIIAGTGQPTPIRRTVTIAIMGQPTGSVPAAPLLARYAFQRCLPTEHRMHFSAQHDPIAEVWRISCESVQRL